MGGLGEQGKRGPLPRQPQHLLPPLVHGQHPDIGRGDGGVLRRDAQIGAEQHPPDAGKGIALCFGLQGDLLQRPPGMDGLMQPVLQPLRRVGQQSKLLRLQADQPGKHGAFQPLRGEQRRPLLQRTGQRRGGGRRQIGERCVCVSLPELLPQPGGGSMIRRRRAVMGRPLPGHRHKLQRQPLPQDGLAVFHRKDIVWLLDQRRPLLHPGKERPLPGGGIGNAGLQLGQRGGHGVVLQQDGSRLPEPALVCILRAEAQMGQNPQPAEDAHAAAGKAFCRLQGIGRGVFHHQICPRLHGCPGPAVLWQERPLAPLDKIAGHTADDGAVCSQPPPDLLPMKYMAAVQRIIFRNHAANPHKYLRKGCQTGKNRVK